MNALTVQSRIPMPAGYETVSPQQWKVLTDAIWPGAKTAEGVTMAIDYCRARKLDPFKRPVHIVPMWNSMLRREVETVWPGISELQTTAARTGQWAGMDAPEWGPEITRTFEGMVGKDNNQRPVKLTITFQEWCSVTVYRMLNGVRCAFCEPVYWIEAYARMGRTDVPNDMWQKRVRGQHHKVAKAASLRAAFPEETGNDYTAEEMEGQSIEHGGVTIETTAEPTPAPAVPQRIRKPFMEMVEDWLAACKTLDDVDAVEQRESVQNALNNAPDDVVHKINGLLSAARKRIQPDENGAREPTPEPEDEFAEMDA